MIGIHNTIKQPGKFEGEPSYVPLYWISDPEEELDDSEGRYFKVFHTPKGVLLLWEDDVGFVYHAFVHPTRWVEFRENLIQEGSVNGW